MDTEEHGQIEPSATFNSRVGLGNAHPTSYTEHGRTHIGAGLKPAPTTEY